MLVNKKGNLYVISFTRMTFANSNRPSFNNSTRSYKNKFSAFNKLSLYLFLALVLYLLLAGVVHSAQQVSPRPGPWKYTACRCNSVCYLEFCTIWNQGQGSTCGTSVCTDKQTPMPWGSEELMVERVQAWDSSQIFEGWLYNGVEDDAGCKYQCWNGVPGYTYGLLSTVKGNFSGGYMGLKSRSVVCPNGYNWSSSQQKCVLPNNGVTRHKTNDWCPAGANDSDPIHSQTGVNIQQVSDYHSAGIYPLEFTRYYSSGTHMRQHGLGLNWRHTYARSIHVIESTNITTAIVTRPNGNEYFFNYNSITDTWESDPDVTERLFELTDGSGNRTGWAYFTNNDDAESYDVDGKLILLANKAGVGHSLVYNLSTAQGGDGRDNTLDQVVHSVSGRTLNFENDERSRIIKITTPITSEVYEYEYDNEPSQLKTVIYPDETTGNSADNPRITYLYNEPEHLSGTGNKDASLTGIIDENGNRYSTWKYTSTGNRATHHILGPEASSGPISQVIITDNGDGTVDIQDPFGGTRTYDFDIKQGVPRLSQVTGSPCLTCGGAVQTATYDANGFPLTRTDFEGNETTFVYNARGLQDSRTEANNSPEQRTISTLWHATYRVPTKITEPGKETTFTYNSTGQVLTRTEKDTNDPTVPVRTTTFTYDTNGNVLTIDGPRTDIVDITTFTYDPITGDRVTMKVDPDGNGPLPIQTTQFTSYDNNGRLLSLTDPNGVVTKMVYDPRGRLKTRTVASGTTEAATTTFEYDGAGNIKKTTLPDGSYLSYLYDEAQRLYKITDNNANEIEYKLDALGNREEELVSDLGGLRRSLYRQFSALSEMEQYRTGEMVNPIIYGYDGNGNQTSADDPTKPIAESYYDALSRLYESKDPDLHVTQYEYDGRDNLTKVTDARNLVTNYLYNGLDDLKELQSPDTGDTDYEYDDAGNRTKQTDAKNVVTDYEYDALNRLKSIKYPANANLNVTFTYDQGTNGIGRLTQIDDEVGSTSFEYDRRGNIKKETLTISSRTIQGTSIPQQTKITSYEYDLADNLKKVTYPNGRVVDYTRNVIGQVSEVKNGSTFIASNIQYMPFGPMKSLMFGSNITQNMTYDLDYRLDTKVAGGIQNIDINYHTNTNNISSILDNIDSSNNQTFNLYDNLDRLKDASSSMYGLLSYSYDGVGNRTNFDDQTNFDTYNYATASNRVDNITGAHATTFGYDNVGNILTQGSKTFSYSKSNRMKSFSDSGSSADYVYNGQGERVIKVVDGEVTIFHYDPSGNLIEETNEVGTAIRQYVYVDGQRLALFQPHGGSSVLPYSRSLQVNSLGSVRASIVNAETMLAKNCGIRHTSGEPITFHYNQVDSQNNIIAGNNVPADIPGGGIQNYVLFFTPTAAFATTDIEFEYSCDNLAPIGKIVGVNTVLLTAENNPVSDNIVVSTTADLDLDVGITKLFAVASTNVGNAGNSITVSMDTNGNTTLLNQLTMLICETNPSGTCIQSFAPTVTLNIPPGTSKTFAISVTASSAIANDPANNRIFVWFRDTGGIVRGATSTAVRTQ